MRAERGDRRRGGLRERCNAFLDGVVRRRTVVAGRTVDSYGMWVAMGVVAGTAVIFGLTAEEGLSLGMTAAIVGMVAALSLALFKSTRLLRRPHPVLLWAKRGVYHFQIVALICTIALLEAAGRPVLPYLDVLAIGMMVYQLFGRIGCLMAGCCHGRPYPWGVRYGREHAATGYVYFVQGVRLFPVQLLEALWLLALALGALAILLGDQRAGAVVPFYIVGYGVGRFALEFARGDMRRVVIRGLSEPQWTALALIAAVMILQLGGVLPGAWWLTAAPLSACVAVAATVGTVSRADAAGRLSDLQQLLRSEHQILADAHLTPVRGSEAGDPGVTVYAPRRPPAPR
jgi:prolipoprotein diacylglyceryltransferase